MNYVMAVTATKRLRPHHKAKVQQLLTILDHYKVEAQRMEVALAALLRDEYGADVQQESWELDAAKGVLRKYERVEQPDV